MTTYHTQLTKQVTNHRTSSPLLTTATMDRKPKTSRFLRLFNSGNKIKTTEQFSIGASLARPASSPSYRVISRSRSPARDWPGQNPRFSQDARGVHAGYPALYGDHVLPSDDYNPSLYTRSQSLDASVKPTRQLIIGIDFVS